ncbi:phage tail tape measure protein [Desulfovibrio psychrotolerans]|uniref:Phage tail tape measure protein domain-containing protein n=1 Tax=Desulfovibrio psychrotolerans TaxID=415242 RepID=A0A7J0BVI5_9BACT|nr:phage tail tape measure protein [Desulfovibrio psychrotolerans]GFM37729.1 hypothetical protein DSM19430T_24130 [Desulfovibrio psychrotolerans]
MSTKLEKLTFSIDLLTKGVTGKVGEVQRSLDSLASKSSAAFMQIGMGAAGVAGAGMSLLNIVQPAREMNKALAEVSTLDVSDQALKLLSNEALKYSIQFGESATAFVSSAYDIQSSIAGLDGSELAKFTRASNVLAKATKADAATMTGYMGTMYGIFKQQADVMGKAEWVEQLTGQTATAVKMFSTNGREMSSAFTSLGANATAAGIQAAEQMAILGTLQASMSGSEAGTKYKAFLAGVGNAQKTLGLSFTDSQGRMLGMMDILGKLKGKFGDTLSLADAGELKKAFGSEEAVSLINMLMADTKGLGAAIDQIGNINGMDKASQMAGKMVDPLDRVAQGANAVRIALGQSILKGVAPFANKLADTLGVLSKWTQMFPNITKWVGTGLVVILGLAAALGTLSIITGMSRVAMIGLQPAITALTWGLNGMRTAITLVNLAWKANPLGMIIGGIGLLIAALPTLLGLWDSFKQAFGDTLWGKVVMAVLNPVVMVLRQIGGAVSWVLDKLGLLPEFSGALSSAVQGVSASGGQGVVDTPAMLDAPRSASVPSGGVTQSISNAMTRNSSNSRTIQQVNITTSKELDAQSINEMAWMAAG